MNKINIDGLLALNLEEIEIVYRRCRGDTVQKIAIDMGIGASTIWNERLRGIFKLLDVQKWNDIEEELCIPLRRIIPNVDALKQGWPEAFREKIEALKETTQPSEEVAAIKERGNESPPIPNSHLEQKSLESRTESNQPGSESASKSAKAPPPREPMQQQRRVPPPPTRRLPWPLIAIPLLLVCVLCISTITFGWQFIESTIGNALTIAQATNPSTSTPELSITPEPTHTSTALPTETIVPIVAQTSLPTSTNTALPSTPTSLPPTSTATETVSPTPSNSFETSFEAGIPDWMKRVYGEVNLIDGKLVAQEPALLAIGDGTWRNYEVEYETKKHTYCWFLEDNGVAAHAPDSDNMIVWLWNYCESAWFEVVNGKWIRIEGSHQGSVDDPGKTIKIRLVAENGNFTLYVNNKQRTSIYDERYLQGKVYIYFSKNAVIDNIRIIPIP